MIYYSVYYYNKSHHQNYFNRITSSEMIIENNPNKTDNIENMKNINNMFNYYNKQNQIIKISKKSQYYNREEVEDKDIDLNNVKLKMIYNNSSDQIYLDIMNTQDIIQNKENNKIIEDNNKIKEIHTENLILNKAKNKSRKK